MEISTCLSGTRRSTCYCGMLLSGASRTKDPISGYLKVSTCRDVACLCFIGHARVFGDLHPFFFVLDTCRPIIVNRVFCGMFLSSATRTIDLLLRYSKRFAFRYLHRFFFTCARAVRSVSVVFLWHVCVSRYQDNRPCYCGVQKASPFEITCFFFIRYVPSV